MSIQPTSGATNAISGSERPLPVMPVKAKVDTPAQKQHTPLAQINSTKAMKIAEKRGDTFTIGEEQLIAAIERANRALQGSFTSFEFSIHEATKEIMVKVLDRDTGEIIREIPSEKVLDLVAKMWEMAGVFVDERR